MWHIDLEYIRSWLNQQDTETLSCVFAAIERLEQSGPALGRPLVDTLSHAKIKNLKELRPASPGKTEVRIIFAFDPKRQAIMLLGGDKAKAKSGKRKWSGWYKEAIPKAEELFEAHLRQLGGNDE